MISVRRFIRSAFGGICLAGEVLGPVLTSLFIEMPAVCIYFLFVVRARRTDPSCLAAAWIAVAAVGIMSWHWLRSSWLLFGMIAILLTAMTAFSWVWKLAQ